jgi:hypothetical protein
MDKVVVVVLQPLVLILSQEVMVVMADKERV